MTAQNRIEFDKEREAYIEDYMGAATTIALSLMGDGPDLPAFREPGTISEARAQRAVLSQRFPYLNRN